MSDHGLLLFALHGTDKLGVAVAAALGRPPAAHEHREFDDGEHKGRPLEVVRGSHVFVLHNLHGEFELSPNDKLCQLLFFVGALKNRGAGSVTVVAPYLCYARKDRRTKPQDPVTMRYVASLFEAVGTDTVVTLDVHNPAAFENAFADRRWRLPQRRSSSTMSRRWRTTNIVSCLRDPGGMKRADVFHEGLETALARPVGKAFAEKRRSAGVVTGELFVGDVDGATALIIDDIIVTGGTLVRAARAARRAGASDVLAPVTHGLFMPGVERTIMIRRSTASS